MNIRKFLSRYKGRYLKSLRSKYSEDLKAYFSDNPTIISNNCLAGFVYQDTGTPYTSPTIGMYFFFPDYIEFLSDLRTNLYADLTFTDVSKYELGNERIKKAKHKYPIGLLNNSMEIHFLHYSSREEALEKWKRRLERVNLNNLIVLGTQLDLCTENDIKAFDQLDFEKKIFFTRDDYNTKSGVFIEAFKKSIKIGDPYQSGHILYKHLIKKVKNKA
ncbi:uncharacterized protein (DUF1919 family) [Mucilaginibacter oryzae]|uniref:Uncharacterized protein (DUF1919 family) n=1 Tax=Mucilaginibacter oryzae TaxID=468058 RepID=A0A316HB64_9SPHI|nr:DUF1919 domain-containing protein [Mucilaginibacter oryzae]PWK77728.1 uncharacterized protein (DUF1919 family) [Mucilaginibacter oryzae]